MALTDYAVRVLARGRCPSSCAAFLPFNRVRSMAASRTAHRRPFRLPSRALGAATGLATLLLSAATPVHAATPLQPPPGYRAAAGNGGSFRCEELPAPFTAALSFPSKYEGSGPARDQLNEDADARYKALSKPITDLEKGLTKVVDKYRETGKPEAVRCALDAYLAWAKAGALQQEATTYSGRAMRKWALGSLSGAWLHLKFSASQPLKAYPEQTRLVEQWLAALAEQVTAEWDIDHASGKINNHYYWAAWAVMATAVALDRHDLYDWSLKVFRHFEQQVDRDGYLPDELDRETRALGYHNYAITPLAMMAAFAKANGTDLASEGNGALKRLAAVTLAGIDDPALFEKKTGKPQELDNIDAAKGKLIWLVPYCWATDCGPSAQQKLASLGPQKTPRLGGNVSAVFATR